MEEAKGWETISEYLDEHKVRKWSEKDIRIKLTNLAKILGMLNVQAEIQWQKKYTDNECDAMNLAYYALKNKFSKIQRSKFGFVRTPEYEPKKKRKAYYDNCVWYNYNDYTSLYTTSYTTTSGTYYGSIWGN